MIDKKAFDEMLQRDMVVDKMLVYKMVFDQLVDAKMVVGILVFDEKIVDSKSEFDLVDSIEKFKTWTPNRTAKF